MVTKIQYVPYLHVQVFKLENERNIIKGISEKKRAKIIKHEDHIRQDSVFHEEPSTDSHDYSLPHVPKLAHCCTSAANCVLSVAG